MKNKEDTVFSQHKRLSKMRHTLLATSSKGDTTQKLRQSRRRDKLNAVAVNAGCTQGLIWKKMFCWK